MEAEEKRKQREAEKTKQLRLRMSKSLPSKCAKVLQYSVIKSTASYRIPQPCVLVGLSAKFCEKSMGVYYVVRIGMLLNADFVGCVARLEKIAQ
jgi:hypothetical protein